MKVTESAATAATSTEGPCKTRVRDRIFDTACELFYRQGIRGVGVDAIASEAGTNKMSFYRSFPSKDELVAEYVREAAREFNQWWDCVVSAHPGDPRAQVDALFEAAISKPPDMNCNRGCAMANVMVEIQEQDHLAVALVREHKGEIRHRLRELALQMGARDPEVLGDSLMLLMGGAYQSRMIFPDNTGPVAVAAVAARKLVAAHLQ